MKLEDIVNVATFPFRAVDDILLRQYTKVTKAWERKGRDPDTVAAGVGMPGFFCMIMGSAAVFPKANELLIPFIFPMVTYGYDLMDNYVNVFERDQRPRRQSVSGDKVYDDNFPPIFKEYSRIIRLPTFIAGVAATAKCVSGLLSWYVTGEPNPDAIGYGLLGMGLLGVASSQYIKDRDPKILERDPLWKQAYYSLTEMIPVPYRMQPIPIPVRR